MTKNTATETVTLSNLNTTTRPAKARKTPTVAASATNRKAAARKALTKEIRALERIRVSIEKAAAVISTQGEDITGATGDQIADMLYKMGVSVSVIDAGINEKAGYLAATFIK
jgi:hypothetical protein